MKVSKKGVRSSGRSRPKAKPRTRRAISYARVRLERPRLIVGIGASAGGLNAFKGFLDNVPPDTGMAFVLVQHLDPHHKSMLVELLGSHTAMPVAEAAHGVAVAANHVYVIPPDATLWIKDGVLQLETPAPPRERRRPIDSFFASLAEDQGENGVCIILSGSGSDGSIGLRAIKELGGLCLAQAEFDATAMSGMPDSATATGMVDYVLPVEAMPAKLIEYQRHLTDVAESKDADGSRHDMPQHLAAITALLRSRIGHDFGQYKDKTLIRRIQRRMQVLQISAVSDYVERLKKEPSQVEALYRDLLIGVTQFFRNEAAFAALQVTVIPKLLERLGKEPDKALRIWVPGCATGEEVYSIAIAVQESMHKLELVENVQIFGTDLDANAIAVARAGRYAESMEGVPAERLQRWFVKDGKEYCPIKKIREMCIFSQHSIIKDPPFSQVDLISCRNVLIYLNTELQDKVLRIFHYALRSDGYLFLGPAEGVTRNSSLFIECDKKHRIFQRRNNDPAQPGFKFAAREPRARQNQLPTNDAHSSGDRLDRIGRRIMEKYSPVYVIVDGRNEILRFSGGELGPYLQPSSGKASLDLFSVLRKGLRQQVQYALKTVRNGAQRSVSDHVAMKVNGQDRIVSLIVEPIPERESVAGHCIVAFDTIEPAALEASPTGISAQSHDTVVKALEQELRSTRAQLEATTDDLETSNEELKSANEEYQSVNEEMQATNEELETSKEELQSINEELHTLNGELAAKNQLMASLNSDLQNLLDSSHIATVFLDNELRIKTFTPSVRDLFNVRDVDRGRPITDLAIKLRYDHLRRDVQKVLESLSPIEAEVSLPDRSGNFIMRIRPYLTVDRVVTGVVVTFIDITERYRDDARRVLLLNELNHRVKNTLATVLSIATQTLKNAPNPEDFRRAFLSRILALSRTHDLLTQAEWRKVTLKDLALSELSPFGRQGARWRLEGEDVWLPPQTILAIGMALHELATNAAKYGALSVPTGMVELTWEVRSIDGGHQLHLRWTEAGGPPVHKPTRTGFGLRLIGEGLTHELDGAAQIDFEPTGVRCTIDVPLVQPAKEPL